MPLFRTKTFDLCQDRTAMKVGTDAILLGAWGARLFPHNIQGDAMDIGAGTGIISLMLAQSYPDLRLRAVEVEEGAAQDAQTNFASSVYADRLQLIHANIHEYLPLLPKRSLDIIVSNPPYFASQGLHAPELERSIARHEGVGGLSLRQLMQIGRDYLSDEGSLLLITPADRLEDLRRYATEHLLYPVELTEVYSSAGKLVRVLSHWQRLRVDAHYQPTSVHRLLIRDDKGELTPSYRQLIANYLIGTDYGDE